jgi:Tfp pilus assembly protein PilX
MRRHIPMKNPAFPKQQRGIALVVGLVILVILALLGTTAYSVATQEERMAGNARDHARAFQSAEFALRECEKVVLAQQPVFDLTGTTNKGMYLANVNGYWVGDTVDPNAWNAVTLQNVYGGSAPPRCIAEAFASGARLDPATLPAFIPHTARVTAAGYGIGASTKVILVSYVTFFDPNLTN